MRVTARRISVAGLALVLAGPAGAQDRGEMRLVQHVFAQLQPLSFQQNREFCGYIFFDDQNRLQATPARRGSRDSCDPGDPGDLDIIASYHTHGDFDEETWAEFPSGEDMEGDEADGIDGWVATPGGRLWYIDTEDMVTFQVCGIGCLPQSPRFVEGVYGRIAQSYTYDDLVRRIAD